MFKKTAAILGVAAFLTAVVLQGAAVAGVPYVMDGNLADWGVTPFSDWQPTRSSVNYVVQNNYNGKGSDAFQECYDIEAMYFDDCPKYIFFAVVSSNSYVNGWASEDLALDFSGKTAAQLLKNGSYKYGADISPLPLETLSTKKLYEVKSWNSVTRDGHVFDYSVKSGTVIGEFQVFNHFAGNIEPGVGNKGTYILEGMIDKSIFGDLTCGMTAELLFTRVSCLKDWITVRGTMDAACVPEPSTMVMLGLGALGTGLFGRRKAKK